MPEYLCQYILTFCGGDEKKENINEIVDFNRKVLNEADVYLVEVCTLKLIRYKNVFLQRSRFLDYKVRGIEKPSLELESGYKEYVQNEDDFAEIDSPGSRVTSTPLLLSVYVVIFYPNYLYQFKLNR